MNIWLMNLIVLFLSAMGLIFSADLAIKAVSRFAKKLGASEYLVGFVIVALGTSTPELVTALTASIAGLHSITNSFGELILGNLIGANLLDVTIVLGVMAIIAKELKIKEGLLSKTAFFTMIIVTLPLVLGVDGRLSRIDGIILIISFLFYLRTLWKKEVTLGRLEKKVPFRKLIRDLILFLISIPIIIFSAKFFVSSAVGLAHTLNIPSFIIGLTLASIGTTLPELSVETRSALSGHNNIGFGDILGSVAVNITLILGIAALINPIRVNISSFATSAMFMVTSVYIAILFIDKKKITWKEGIGLLMIYSTFLISEGIISLFA